MNHAVVSLLGEEPAKVRCRTCHSDHDYRHETAPPPKVDPRKAALFNQVLEKVTGDVPGVVAEDVAAVAPVTLEAAPVTLEAAPVTLEAAPVTLEAAPVTLEALPEAHAAEAAPAVLPAPAKAAKTPARAKKG